MRAIIPVVMAILLLGAVDSRAAQILQIGHLELLGAYSQIKKGNSDVGEDLKAFWAPVIKLSDTYSIIPLIDIHLERVAQFLPQEEGNRFNNTYFTNNFSLASRKEFLPG